MIDDIRENIRNVYGVQGFPNELRALADEYEANDSAISGVAMMREAADKLDAVERVIVALETVRSRAPSRPRAQDVPR